MRNHPTLRWGIVSAAMLAAGLSLGELSALTAPASTDTDKVFVGYLFGSTSNIDFRLYTHLCHAFLTADGEGRVQKRGSVPSRQLTDAAHKAGVRVILSLGGWGWDKQFASIISKPETEDRYARSVMEIVDQFDYDGIDFDWEYPDTRDEVAGFERLTRRFRKELDELGRKKGRSMQVTMAPGSVSQGMAEGGAEGALTRIGAILANYARLLKSWQAMAKFTRSHRHKTRLKSNSVQPILHPPA
jgi:chitinase